MIFSNRASVSRVSVSAKAGVTIYLVNADAVQARIVFAIVRVYLAIFTSIPLLAVTSVLARSRIANATFRVEAKSAVGAWSRRTLVAVVCTVYTPESCCALAGIRIVHVDAVAVVQAGLDKAFVRVDSTIAARPSIFTRTGESVQSISANSTIQARRQRAVVCVYLTVVPFVARYTLAKVLICLNECLSGRFDTRSFVLARGRIAFVDVA